MNPPPEAARALPLRRWLQTFFPGSVEHTRNGHDQLARVQDQRGVGRLGLPNRK